jgi:hypothetical protein
MYTNSMMSVLKKKIRVLYFLPAVVALIIYPFILLANVMSLAAEYTEYPSPLAAFIIKAFLITSSLYPIVLGLCLKKFWSAVEISKEIKWIMVFYGYVVICGILFFIWNMLDSFNW